MFNPQLKLNPVVLLVGLFAVSISFTATHSFYLNIYLTVLVTLLVLILGYPLKRWLIIIALGILAAWGYYQTAVIYGGGHEQGLEMGSRVFVYISLGLLFTTCVQPEMLLLSLRDQAKLPETFIYGMMTVMNLIPSLKREVSLTKISFHSRKLKSRKYQLKFLNPLLVKVMLWSDTLSKALYSKGFHESKTRTHHITLRVKRYDYFILCVLLGISIAIHWL